MLVNLSGIVVRTTLVSTTGVRPPIEQILADLPVGGDYGSILAYFVERFFPTWRFLNMNPDLACVAAFAFLMGDEAVPAVYVYLDSSLVPNSWYYIYRYILLGKVPVPPTTGPVAGSPGPMTLISSNHFFPPPDGYFQSPFSPVGNPLLSPVSGNEYLIPVLF